MEATDMDVAGRCGSLGCGVHILSVRRAVTAREPEEARMSAGEAPIKQAIRWIDDQLHANPRADRLKLVDEASRRFDLSPVDGDFLFRHLASKKT
jgi:hypothetical protein